MIEGIRKLSAQQREALEMALTYYEDAVFQRYAWLRSVPRSYRIGVLLQIFDEFTLSARLSQASHYGDPGLWVGFFSKLEYAAYLEEVHEPQESAEAETFNLCIEHLREGKGV